VNGDITASKRIEMGRVAKVTGNIQTPALVIENGAIFEGSCRMVQIKEQSDRQSGDRKAEPSSTSSTSSTSSSSSSSSAAPAASTSGTSTSPSYSSSSSGGTAAKSASASSSSDVKDATDAVS